MLLVVALPLSAAAQQRASAPEKELLAVLDLEVIGATKEQGAVLTNQLRAEMLKSGRFVMVNRAQLDRILEEQALQQQVCSEANCAVRVGSLLGVRKIVTGSVTKITETLWQVSATMTDVETGQIERQAVVNHAGDFASLFLSGMASVAKELAATEAEMVAGSERLSPETIAPTLYEVLQRAEAKALLFSPDSHVLYYGVDDQVRRWDVAQRRDAGPPFKIPKGSVTALAVSREGDRMAVGTHRGYVHLLDARTGRVVHTEDPHDGTVYSLDFSPADNYYASGGKDEEVHVYNARTGRRLFELDGAEDEVNTVRFSHDGTYLFATDNGRLVRVYDVNLQREVRSFKESAKRLLFAELSHDGSYLAIAAKLVDIDVRRNRRLDTEVVRIRNPESGEELLSFEAHDKTITGLAFFPDRRFLATGAEDKKVKIWDLQSKAPLSTLTVAGRVTHLALSPDGRWLAAADDENDVSIWEVVK